MSTYSPSLRIELITTGDQAGVWGNTTNTNLGTLVESAIAGYVSVSVIAANQALTALNGAADQSRNMTIALTTTTGAAFNVYAPPAEKTYVIQNASSYAATIYNSTVLGNTTAAGTGVTVPAGKTVTVWSDGTNFRFQNDHMASLTLASPLAAASGGTGLTSLGAGVATFLGTPSSANLRAAVTDETGSGALVFATSPTLVTPALGTPSSVVLTNATGLPNAGLVNSAVTVNGNSVSLGGSTTITAVNPNALTIGTGLSGTSYNGSSAVTVAIDSTVVTLSGTQTLTNKTLTNPTLTNPALGTPASGTLTNATGLPIVAGTTGTLSVARGGTGVTTSTGTGNVVLSNSPTLVTPALGTPSALVGTNITGTAAGLSIGGNAATATNATTAATVSTTIASGATGTTQTFGTNNTTMATTAFVQAAMQALHPVGSIYINATNSTNPGTLLGFGTWSAFGAGRVPVGFNAADPLFDAAEETGGSKDATLVGHNHSASTALNGGHEHRVAANVTSSTQISGNAYMSYRQANVSGDNWDYILGGTSSYPDLAPTSYNGEHTHSVTVDAAGSSATNANLQPYITVYMWKRTA